MRDNESYNEEKEEYTPKKKSNKQTLEYVKNRLVKGKIVSLPIVFWNQGKTRFLVDSYINKLGENYRRTIKKINNLQEIEEDENSLLGDSTDQFIYLYELEDKNVKISLDLIEFYDIIILVNKEKPFNIYSVIDESITNIIEFPDFENWQVEAYFQSLVPGLSEEECKWMCSITNYDIYRLTNEANKLNIFPVETQQKVFKYINSENGYSDLNNINVFNLTNSIMNKNYADMGMIIKDLEYLEIDPLTIVGILLKQFTLLACIKENFSIDANKLGIGVKQLNILKYNAPNFDTKKLINNIQFLSSLDKKLKSGELDLNNNDLIVYIISNIV